jgi:predicted nucleic acid-binding protein
MLPFPQLEVFGVRSMSQPNTDDRRSREAAEARAALERRAAELGVSPFDADEWLGAADEEQSPEEAAREVDDFLRIVRELRDTPSDGSAG